nr:MAG TPA: hypothetical protein [Bacteriophage sp.]DAT87000.1 MAG TPA: hypothetical protein [Caudoviricetes sp.]
MLFFGICEPIDTVSFVWVLLSPTRTLSVKDGARPSGWSISCVYPTMHDRVTHST